MLRRPSLGIDDVLARLAPFNTEPKRNDPRIDQWEAARVLARSSLDAAALMEMTARNSKLRALKVLTEIEVRLELLRDELGLTEEEDEHETNLGAGT